MNAEHFAKFVLNELRQLDDRAGFLSFRTRGKASVIGFDDDGEWVPLFRIVGGSAAYNVANLQIRHRNKWEPTLVRGGHKVIADELAGPLRFFWEANVGFRPE